LDFNGRVKKASVKNFQMYIKDDPNEEIVLQFGKISDDKYILDFK